MLTSSIISTGIKRTYRVAAMQHHRICAFSAVAEEQYEHDDWDDKTNVTSSDMKVTHHIMTYNKLSHVGLQRFPSKSYAIFAGEDSTNNNEAHAILLRSHKLKEEEIPHTVRAIARCGAGTNNIPVSRMTELGIPVFNTPGANANAVKELVLCGLFLGSRRVVDGTNHMKQLGKQGLARERVEKDKAMFGGRELKGKTLAVIGLGNIGSMTADDASKLGMKIKGYDPSLNVQRALQLPDGIELADSIASAVSDADYISINIPYIKGEGGTHGIIDTDIISNFKSDAVLLNFARGELVDSDAMKTFLDNNEHSRYISDFPDDILWDHKNVVILPHLGASTYEAEDAAASMAADTVRDFLETGNVQNSVNFPTTVVPEAPPGTVRFTVINENIPGVLADITDCIANQGLNIEQQINQSRDKIAYNVFDFDVKQNIDNDDNNIIVQCLKKVQESVITIDGVINSRIIFIKQ